MTFGRHLRGCGRPPGCPGRRLARRAGVPLSTLLSSEGDNGFPSLPAALRLAKALGVPAERFAEGVEAPAEED
jgi:transcriptional regulator with XRE-family HTH domain